MPESTPMLRAALGAAARGWHVFPVVPGGKRPAIKAWQQRATTDPARIQRCWTAGPFNVGIACGPSGLVVVDLDTPKPGQRPPAAWQIDGVNNGADVFTEVCDRAGQPVPDQTYTVTTGRGGTHLYYRHPDTGPELRNTAGSLGWLVDTRAHGGYVLAAGSVVDGRAYTLAWNSDPAPLPGWLADRLQPLRLPPPQPVRLDLADRRRGAYLNAAIRRQLDHLAAAPEGQRNHALFVAAVALGQLAAGGALDTTDVEGLLTQAALQAGLRPAETARTIASGLRAGARRPRSVAA